MLVRYYGHVGLPTGYGHAANEICMAMLAADLELEISTDGKELHNDYLPLARCLRDETALSPRPDVVIVHTLPVDCGRHAERLRPTTPGVPWVAYTTWEGVGPIPPVVSDALDVFDEVWVPSFATSRAMVIRDRIPLVVPHPFDENLIEGCATCGMFHRTDMFRAGMYVFTSTAEDGVVVSERGEDGRVRVAFDDDVGRVFTALIAGMARSTVKVLKDVRGFAPCELRRNDNAYRFYYVGAWTARKNVEGIIRAYLRAFGKDDPVELAIHSAGASPDACRLASLTTGIAPEDCPPLLFTYQRESTSFIRDLHARGNCFVTASRGEAWNLPAFDALLAGNHIIAPRWLGSDDFLVETDADLYESHIVPAFGDVRLVTRPDTPPGYAVAQYMATQGMTIASDWHDPDIAQLADRMRVAFLTNKRRLRVDYSPAQRFGRRAVGAQIKALLEGLTR